MRQLEVCLLAATLIARISAAGEFLNTSSTNGTISLSSTSLDQTNTTVFNPSSNATFNASNAFASVNQLNTSFATPQPNASAIATAPPSSFAWNQSSTALVEPPFSTTTSTTSQIKPHRLAHFHRSCGTHDPSEMDLRIMSFEVEDWATNNTWALINMTSNSSDIPSIDENVTDASNTSSANNVRLLRYLASTSKRYIIPVFFNVLALSETEGTMADVQLTKILRLMNSAYNQTNFQFVLQGIQRRTGAFWHNCTVNNQNEWKTPLYVSGSNALNIFYCRPTYVTTNGAAVESQGFSSWPTNANNVVDGLVIPHPKYYGPVGTQQYTIHEAGHWMGLLHTYAGGCTSKERVFENMVVSDGDGVQDTPAHATQTSDIVSGMDTCWQNVTIDTCDDVKNPLIDPGNDPVTNYMNFVPPKCWEEHGEFTPGQNLRMLAIYEQFRLASPWKCKSSSATCRESFECCGVSQCVKSTNKTVGKCSSTAPACKFTGATCVRNLNCCSGLTCQAGVCKAKPKATGGGAKPPVVEPGCQSILCRSQTVRRRRKAPRVRARQLGESQRMVSTV
ncbi:hypothetical protein MPSEU_000999200 [Mayamaea pseudoterrestris]|nr:hypothetical protein MPSEU_000999200 [Mayamaea pseudoterrestris]